MASSNKWLQVRNTLARAVRGWRLNWREIYGDLTLEDLKHAEWLAALTAMPELSKEVEKKNNLALLNIFYRHGLARTRGRLSEEDMIASRSRATGQFIMSVLTAELSFDHGGASS